MARGKEPNTLMEVTPGTLRSWLGDLRGRRPHRHTRKSTLIQQIREELHRQRLNCQGEKLAQVLSDRVDACVQLSGPDTAARRKVVLEAMARRAGVTPGTVREIIAGRTVPAGPRPLEPLRRTLRCSKSPKSAGRVAT